MTNAPPVEPVLTIVAHPNPARIGQRCWLGGAESVAISRSEFDFVADGETRGAPLDDPFLSRRPLRLSALSSGGVSLDARETSIRVEVDGRVHDLIVFTPRELHSGVFITLNARVMLYFHVRSRPLDLTSGAVQGRSMAAEQLRRTLAQLDTNGPVIFRGEPGSGREYVARSVTTGPFVGIAADRHLDELDRLASPAGGGEATVFLHELDVAEMGRERLHDLAAKHRLLLSVDSWDQAAESLGWPIVEVPALRERLEDIPAYFRQFLHAVLAPDDRPRLLRDATDDEVVPIEPALIARLMTYRWPENLRELRELAAEIALRSRAADRLHWASALEMPSNRLAVTPVSNPKLRMLDQVDDAEVLAAWQQSGGDEKAAARILGVSRGTLGRLLARQAALQR